MSGALLPFDSLDEVETLLTAESARSLLTSVVETRRSTLSDFSVSQISYRPGRRITVVYETVDTEGVRLPVVLAAGKFPAEAAVFEGAGQRVGAWTAWRDPAIPGLAAVLDPRTREELLRPIGVPDVPTTARLRSYRPGKRAVVEITGDGVRLFVKTIRPRDVAALQEAHESLAVSLPIPRSLGWSPEAGIVVLEPMAGLPLSSAPDQGPDPQVLRELLDRIPALDRPVTPRTHRLAAHLKLLRRIAPSHEPQFERIEYWAQSLLDSDPTPVHGDFHSGQIMVSNGALTGLVDIDTVGTGQRADDHANLLAHLHVIALRNPNGDAASYGERYYQAALGETSPDDLHIRIAATMLGYASGPWSRQESAWPTRVRQLIEAACEWLPADRSHS